MIGGVVGVPFDDSKASRFDWNDQRVSETHSLFFWTGRKATPLRIRFVGFLE